LRRREVALISGRDDREGLELLSPTHYLEQALEPTAELIEGAMADILLANPDAIILADVATISAGEAEPLLEWVEQGGLLVRFAGPRLAASDVSRGDEDPLMPVRLRAGGRTVGGAMSWGEPKTLRAFTPDSPFFGLTVSDEINVTAQVMAQPDPTLADRTIASLADGTPLVTRKRVEQGQIVLFHVTANAEWSSLPLSGLFVQMLERLAVSTRPASPSADDLAGTTWTPDQVLTGFGEVIDAGVLPGIPGEALVDPVTGPELRPGLYTGEDQRLALNAVSDTTEIAPAVWPARVPIEGLAVQRETILKGAFLTGALFMLMLDIIAALWLSGRLTGPRPGMAAALLAAVVLAPQGADAQDTALDDFALTATTEVVLAHVITGDRTLDDMASAGLRGLSDVLFSRTSIEPADPIAVDLEMD
ncbi:MAG: LytTR family transcriptional regulator, partial [Pseudomonadota bacterium]